MPLRQAGSPNDSTSGLVKSLQFSRPGYGTWFLMIENAARIHDIESASRRAQVRHEVAALKRNAVHPQRSQRSARAAIVLRRSAVPVVTAPSRVHIAPVLGPCSTLPPSTARRAIVLSPPVVSGDFTPEQAMEKLLAGLSVSATFEQDTACGDVPDRRARWHVGVRPPLWHLGVRPRSDPQGSDPAPTPRGQTWIRISAPRPMPPAATIGTPPCQ
jgi:hypothetical protein